MHSGRGSTTMDGSFTHRFTNVLSRSYGGRLKAKQLLETASTLVAWFGVSSRAFLRAFSAVLVGE